MRHPAPADPEILRLARRILDIVSEAIDWVENSGVVWANDDFWDDLFEDHLLPLLVGAHLVCESVEQQLRYHPESFPPETPPASPAAASAATSTASELQFLSSSSSDAASDSK